MSSNYSLIGVYMGGGGVHSGKKTTLLSDKWLSESAEAVQRVRISSLGAEGPREQLRYRTGACFCIKGPLLKGTRILGTKSSKGSRREQMTFCMFQKKKKEESERVWGFLMAAKVSVIICTWPTKHSKTPSVPA